VALALRCSPARAQRYVGWASVLTTELPLTFAALQSGRTTQWRAMIVARETIWLSREHRARVDSEMAGQLAHLGDRKVEAAAKRIAYRLDPHGFVARSRAAENDRPVTLRPAPETMARLTALLPVAQGVAAYVALTRQAEAAAAAGDDRGRGQGMADTLVERVTGQARAEDVPVEVHLVMTGDTLLDEADEPAEIDGYGPVPAGLARRLAVGADQAPRWLTHSPRRPRHTGGARRSDCRGERAGLLPGLQQRETGTRLDDVPGRDPRRSAPGRHHHAHRAPLLEPCARSARMRRLRWHRSSHAVRCA
jgi:hypothetical protein